MNSLEKLIWDSSGQFVQAQRAAPLPITAEPGLLVVVLRPGICGIYGAIL